MKIQLKPMGNYQTNCYIVSENGVDIVIDPGVGAFEWVKDNTTNLVAILNTHGHFDHIWSNQEIKKYFNIPIYCPKDDAFMLENDIFGQNIPLSQADIFIKGDETLDISGIEVKFHLFAGHTPGCSVITIDNYMFSGDFIFRNSIGRVDLPYSNTQDMYNSILKVLEYEKDYTIYPGHGQKTTLYEEKANLENWLSYLSV